MTPTKRSNLFIISLLGALSVVSPFSIDMYLPAFTQMAKDLHTTSATISLSLSSYFIGLALGQIFYGPLLDRFGRKRPLYAGLVAFIIASLACSQAPSIEALVVMRFIQALGGCVAGVASVAMVRDFFPVEDSAKVFSLLFLFIGVSPLLAPTVGGLLMMAVGWKAVFLVLAGIVSVILALVFFLLPEGHIPDHSISLRPKPIVTNFMRILKHPQFHTNALSGAFSFAGLFAYVAGSPIIFMEGFHLSAQTYGGVFAVLTMGFIGGNQLNVFLLRTFSSKTLLVRGLMAQAMIGVVFALGSYAELYGLPATMVLFFAFLVCAGVTYPNSAALALEPFTKNAGSASALMGFLQMGVGSLISTGIGMSASHSSMPIIAILAITSLIGLVFLLLGNRTLDHRIARHESKAL